MNPNKESACRETYWEEKNDAEKILKLGQIVEDLSRQIILLQKEVRLLNQHDHANGEITIRLNHVDEQPPYYMSHILGRGSK